MLQIEQMKQKDSRIKIMNEVLNGIKVSLVFIVNSNYMRSTIKLRYMYIEVNQKQR